VRYVKGAVRRGKKITSRQIHFTLRPVPVPVPASLFQLHEGLRLERQPHPRIFSFAARCPL